MANFDRLRRINCEMHKRQNNTYGTRNPSVYLEKVKGTNLTKEEKEAEVSKPNPVTEVPFLRLCASARRPYYNTPGSAGLDLFAPHDAIVEPGEQECLPLGIAIKTPPHTYLRLCTRSSLGSRAIEVGAGVVDSDHRGEVLAVIYNFSKKPLYICEGSAICQAIITPFEKREPIEVDYLEQGARYFGLGRDKQAAKILNLEREFKNLRFNDQVLFYEDEVNETKEIVEKWHKKLPEFTGPKGPEVKLLETLVHKEAAEEKLAASSKVLHLTDAVTEYMRSEEADKIWKDLKQEFKDLEQAREKGEAIEKAIEEARAE